MKRTFPCILALNCLGSFAIAQDSASVWQNIRETRPLLVVCDMNGFGAGYAIHPNVDVQAMTMLLSYGVNIKFYLTGMNSAPFVGLGAGAKNAGFGGNGTADRWTVLFAGWQFHPSPAHGLFLAAMYQYPLSQHDPRSGLPTRFSFNVGIRLH